MSQSHNGNGHASHYGRLPFRPPTVDEALPYSPFTSVVPFSPDIISFPSAEPPTPGTTLDPEQQQAARQAVESLNADIRGPPDTSQRLQKTLQRLQTLLQPDDLPQFRFKPIAQIATSVESASSSQPNGAPPSTPPSLSPFAAMLLEKTEVSYIYDESQPHKQPRKDSTPAVRPGTQPRPPQLSGTPSVGFSPSPRPGGPVVKVKPLPPGARPEEYRRIDGPLPEESPSKKLGSGSNAPTVSSREREVANRQLNELSMLLKRISEARDSDDPGYFVSISTDEGELSGLTDTALAMLGDAVSKVNNLGCFPEVSAEDILMLQSLCEPLVTAASRLPFDLESDSDDDQLRLLTQTELGLKGCRMIMQTMTEGRDERRICSEDLIQGIVRLLKRLFASVIAPVVESRRSGSSSQLFVIGSKHKKELHGILRRCATIISQIATLIGKVKLTEYTLSGIESLAVDIIFSQNSAHETDSALGIQKFETFRQTAMDVIAQIFSFHPDQRNSLAVEILTNLEKLPDKRASARNFRSAHESPIMLASALFMRMVQASTNNDRSDEASAPSLAESEEEDAEGDSDFEALESQGRARKSRHQRRTPREMASQAVASVRKVATLIIQTMVAKAENVSKSGDKPFRNLLDLFVGDLCSVLGSPEWPAASLFLEMLLAIMQRHKDKSVQAADMALATMGTMGVGMIDFATRLKAVKRDLDITHSSLSSKLVPLVDDSLKHSIHLKDVLSLDGPYRAVLDSLSRYLNPHSPRVAREDPHFRSLSSYYAAYWAYSFYKVFGEEEQKGVAPHPSVDALEKHIRQLIGDPDWISKDYYLYEVTVSESRVAAGIITMQDPFCKYLQPLISILLANTKNSSAKVRTRAMNCLTQMIEKDPRILNDKTFPELAHLAKDSSPSVRDNTVSLISKCLEQDPSLERYCLGYILNLVADSATAPKKKAIRLLKDIYFTTTETDKKVKIATELLLPIMDDDKAIAELTRHTFEEIWLAPAKGNPTTDESHLRLGRATLIELLICTVQNIQNRPIHLQAFEAFFSMVLSPTAKTSADNFKCCKELVAGMVENVIGTDSATAEKTQARTLQTLGIFAKVSPSLFSADQVQLLTLYVKNLATTDDLAVFHPTVVIFRYVFPALSTLQESFLEEVYDSLRKVVPKIATQVATGNVNYKKTLWDVAHCMWTISPLVKGNPPNTKSGLERLIHLVSQVLVQLEPISYSSSPKAEPSRKIISFLTILGIFGNVCDLDAHVDLFKSSLMMVTNKEIANKKATPERERRLTGWKGHSVAVLLLDVCLPFTRQAWDADVRAQALCSIGEICRQKTRHFTRADIEKAFKLPFINRDAKLMRVALAQFRDFLEAAERRSDTGAEIAVGEGAVHGQERLATSFAASDNDHATTQIARTFLEHIIQTALGKDKELALPATRILVSISRQGLLHPKECGAALVALSTSRWSDIALPASSEHHKIHLQHETMFEKEYVSAVGLAFRYQRDVFEDPRGAIDGTYKPKMQLLFEAFKLGTRKTLKKFISNLLGQLDFDVAKLDVAGEVPESVLYARFCLENCALFDYAKVDEVAHVILTIENIVLKHSGPSVALAIETEIPSQEIAPGHDDVTGGPDMNGSAEGLAASITEERLRRLTSASINLHMMWETRIFLRRVYNLQGKLAMKDIQKPATRMNFITGKEIWERFNSLVAALDTSEAMRKQCRDFAEIINIDREHAVDEDDADATEQLARAAADYETPDEKEPGDEPAPTSGRGRKRKSSAGLSSTPKKPRGRPAGSKSKIKRSSRTPDDSE